jgi:hypothetical protein
MEHEKSEEPSRRAVLKALGLGVPAAGAAIAMTAKSPLEAASTEIQNQTATDAVSPRPLSRARFI